MQVPAYFARRGSRFSHADAQVIGPALVELAESGQTVVPGRVDAQDVVTAAEPNESALHPFFEWDDPKAARLHREEQARKMLQAIVIRIAPLEPGGEPQEVRKFINITVAPAPDDDEPRLRPYLTVEQVLADPQLVRQKANEAMAKLEFWERENAFWRDRDPGFKRQFGPVFSAIETVRTRRQEEVHAAA